MNYAEPGRPTLGSLPPEIDSRGRGALLIGPVIERRRQVARYGSAVALVLGVGLFRLVLSPLLGAQAPLLPFVLAIYGAAYLGGRGPALLACLLSPVVATILFTQWSSNPQAGAWGAHVTLFLSLSILLSLVMDQLQQSYAAQRAALIAAHDAERKATASETQLRLIADALPLLIAYVDKDERYRFHNKGYLDWFGPEDGSVLGRHLREVLGEEVYNQRQPQLRAVLRGESVQLKGHQTHQALGLRECEITYVPDRDSNGETRGFYVMGQDVTERIQAERARELALTGERQAREEAERLGLLKDEFLATLSHELRTPLHAILGWANVLRQEPRSEDHLRRGIESIGRNARMQAQIVDDLIDMSRIVSGKMMLWDLPLNLEDVLAAAIEAAHPAARAKNVALLSALDTPAVVQGDFDRLQQVFWNLISNAVKFTPSGGHIHIRLRQVDSRIEVSIEDTGIGITPEFLPLVFDRFRQANVSIARSDGGLGLGLSIVRSLVEMHGGAVRAKSPGLGQGSTFIVALPISPGMAAGTELPQPPD